MPDSTLLSISLTFNLRGSVKTAVITDTTDYSQIDPAYTDIKGIFDVRSPNNTIHLNSDYTDPDITFADRSLSGIVLPLDNNSLAVIGVYTIYYQVLVNGNYHYRTFTFNYQYVSPLSQLDISIDGYNSRLTSVDNTDYDYYTVNSLTRTHTVTPPEYSGLAPVSNSNQNITYLPNLWSGEWTFNLYTDVSYAINNIIILDTISLQSPITKNVYKINFDVLRTYISVYLDKYIASINSNPGTASSILAILGEIYGYVLLYDKAVLYHDYATAYENAYSIVLLLDPAITTTEEIAPFTDPGGGGTPPIDDKWNRISSVLSPKIIGDKVAIGTTTLIGTEIFRVLGRINISSIAIGDDTVWVDKDGSGNLRFHDVVTGTKLLSDFVAGWNPTNRALLETYTQTDANIIDAVIKKHLIATIGSTSSGILTFGTGSTAQELNIVLSDATHSGYLSATKYVDFNSKQAGNALLTSISGLTCVSGDLLYAINGTSFGVIHAGSALQYLRRNSINTAYEFATPTFNTPGGDTLSILYNNAGEAGAIPSSYYDVANDWIANNNLLSVRYYIGDGACYIYNSASPVDGIHFVDSINGNISLKSILDAISSGYWTAITGGIAYTTNGIAVNKNTITNGFKLDVNGAIKGTDFNSTIYRYDANQNVLIGSNAGASETGSNKLYIGGLVYGDFSSGIWKFTSDAYLDSSRSLFFTTNATSITKDSLGNLTFKDANTNGGVAIKLLNFIDGTFNCLKTDFSDYNAVRAITSGDIDTWNAGFTFTETDPVFNVSRAVNFKKQRPALVGGTENTVVIPGNSIITSIRIFRNGVGTITIKAGKSTGAKDLIAETIMDSDYYGVSLSEESIAAPTTVYLNTSVNCYCTVEYEQNIFNI